MKRALSLTVTVALLTGSSVASAPDWRPAAMHSIASFAVNGALRQFRNLKKIPVDAKRVFDYCQIVPREKFGALFQEMRPVFECEDSWLDVFKSRADFVIAVRNALPAGFTRTASCPKWYDGLLFIACFHGSRGTGAYAAEDGCMPDGKRCSYSLFVMAPPLAANERAKLRGKAEQLLQPILAGMTKIAAHVFGTADAEWFAAQHRAALKGCGVRRPPTGRPVLDCEVRDLWSLSRTDFVTTVRAALPKDFRRSRCVERSNRYAELSSICERNAKNVEVHFGEFFHLEADDTAYPVSRTALMRQFFTIVLAAAARNFQGFDSTAELPYFGRCELRQGMPTEPRYLECLPDDEAVEFDLLAVVRRALPPGYAPGECTVNNWPFLNPAEAIEQCFGARNRPEIDVAEYEYWFVDVGLPNPRP